MGSRSFYKAGSKTNFLEERNYLRFALLIHSFCHGNGDGMGIGVSQRVSWRL